MKKKRKPKTATRPENPSQTSKPTNSAETSTAIVDGQTVKDLTFDQIKALTLEQATAVCLANRPYKVATTGGLERIIWRLGIAKSKPYRICPHCGDIATVRGTVKKQNEHTITRQMRCRGPRSCTFQHHDRTGGA